MRALTIHRYQLGRILFPGAKKYVFAEKYVVHLSTFTLSLVAERSPCYIRRPSTASTPDKNGAMTLRIIIAIVVSYVLGSIPFGYLIVSAKTGGGDIRQTGSAHRRYHVSRRRKNQRRVDVDTRCTKRAAAVMIAQTLLSGVDNGACDWVAGIVAMLGHVFPIWLGFRGGNVATVGYLPLCHWRAA
jgi:hypothetical protein